MKNTNDAIVQILALLQVIKKRKERLKSQTVMSSTLKYQMALLSGTLKL